MLLGRVRTDVGSVLCGFAALTVMLILSCGLLLAASLPMCACGPRSPSAWLAHNPDEMRTRYSITYLNAAKYDAASFLAGLIGKREWATILSADAEAIRKVMRTEAQDIDAASQQRKRF